MGKLIKNHWARLITLAAAACKSPPPLLPPLPTTHTNNPPLTTDQAGAALCGFFWPKIFWDWLTTNLDPFVKPVPILQTINLVFALCILAYEWPLGFIAGRNVHKSIEVRLVVYPLSALFAVLLYQGTNAALYYVVAVGVYFWAYCGGEVSS